MVDVLVVVIVLRWVYVAGETEQEEAATSGDDDDDDAGGKAVRGAAAKGDEWAGDAPG